MNEATRKTMALWRLSVLGPLCSARLEHGDLKAYLEEAAGRVYLDPDGFPVHVAARTIEEWHYVYQHRGLTGLMPRTRSDCGISRAIRVDVAELAVRAKREKPRRSIRRIIKMLERARKVRVGELSRSSVHRLLQRHQVSARPVRGPSLERRSFLPDHVGDLWMGDAMHGPLVIGRDGKLHKSYQLSQIDAASRYLPHSYFALSEDAASQEYGFEQAVLKHGVPRAYYVDLGSAYVATSLREICAELRVHLLHTAPKDCEAKGGIERYHRTWRDEVGDELPASPMTLEELNAVHWAWLGTEYHARVHDTTKRAPREHFLSEVSQLRPVPRDVDIDALFLHREKRTVRKDGTVRWGGDFLEVRSELCGKKVELRYPPLEPEALPSVFVDGRFYCNTVVLDRKANNGRVRRRVQGEGAPQVEPTGLDPLQLIQDEHYRKTRPVGAPPSPTTPHDDDEDDA
jgi:transposase InsO family protein